MGRGPSKNRQGCGKNYWTDHVSSWLPDKKLVFLGILLLKIEKDQMATLCSMEAGVDD